VVRRAQGEPDALHEVGMVWEEGVLPERSERFSSSRIMEHVPLSAGGSSNPGLSGATAGPAARDGLDPGSPSSGWAASS